MNQPPVTGVLRLVWSSQQMRYPRSCYANEEQVLQEISQGDRIALLLQEVGRRHREELHLPDPEVRRYLRARAGVTRKQVASALGISRAAVTAYELGTRTPCEQVRPRYIALLDGLAREVIERRMFRATERS